MYEEYRDRADFFVVYIAEAHTVDGWQMDSNEAAGIRIRQHETMEERLSCARLCAAELRLTIPMAVDTMDNAAFEAYSAWPERIYIVSPGGCIHYKGGPGPFGFDMEEARESLLSLLSSSA
jgi:hypothetical protein